MAGKVALSPARTVSHSVIGVDRGAGARQLMAADPSYVMKDLSELL
jgi:hypothetical protein